MDYVKSFFVGIAYIIGLLWFVLAIAFVIGLMATAGKLWNETWLWVNIVAIAPWGALVILLITMWGEDLRNSGKGV